MTLQLSIPFHSIGTKFNRRYNKGIVRLCTVTDYHVTYNTAGEIVKERYVATHDFMGQTITEYDIVAVTIARGLIL